MCTSARLLVWACLVILVCAQVPDTDPLLDPSEYAPFDDSMLVHPRLLFSPSQLVQLRTDILSPPLSAHYNRMLGWQLSSATIPSNSNFLTDATEAQRQGFWNMPTVAVHYALTGSVSSYNRTIEYMEWIYSYPHWETTPAEVDTGMSAANMMVGAAICYDIVYNDLKTSNATFLEQFRQKIFWHARVMWYNGTQADGYWQADPQNNHRWHRNAGFALCMLAAYEGNPEEEFMRKKLYEEIEFVASWLPEDGTSHESTAYQVFGGAHLTLGLQTSDNLMGTSHLARGYSENVARLRVQSIAPGFAHYFMYGDMTDGGGYYSQYNMMTAAYHNQPDLQNALDHHFNVTADAYNYGWMGVIWRGTSELGGDYHNIPLIDYFDDLGLVFMHDQWDQGGYGAMFKCAPFGGFLLSQYRRENGNDWINVAHDDPDANTFILFKNQQWVAETDRYSHQKQTSNHNYILVDGKGQRANGRAEGAVYSQPPTGSADMANMAYMTMEDHTDDYALMEGEAQGSYPELTRARRTFLWLKNRYVLVLDDIRSNSTRTITWMMQSGQVTTRNAGNLEFTLDKNNVTCDFQVASTSAVTQSVVNGTADQMKNVLGWRQLRLNATGVTNIQFASVYNLWDATSLRVALTSVNSTQAMVAVTVNGTVEQWVWNFAPAGDNRTPGSLTAFVEASPTPSPSPSITGTPSRSPSISSSWSSSSSVSPTATATATPSLTPSHSWSGSSSISSTATATPSFTVSGSSSRSPTATATPSFTVSGSWSSSSSISPTATATPSFTVSGSASSSSSTSLTATATPSFTVSGSESSSSSASRTATATPSFTVSGSESSSSSISSSATPTFSVSESGSGSASPSPSVTESVSASASATGSDRASASPSAMITMSESASPSASRSEGPSASLAASPTASASASNSMGFSSSSSPSQTGSNSASRSTSVIASASSVSLPSSSSSSSHSPAPTATSTISTTSTSTHTPTLSRSATTSGQVDDVSVPTNTATSTHTASPSESPNVVVVPSYSASPAPVAPSESRTSTRTPSASPPAPVPVYGMCQWSTELNVGVGDSPLGCGGHLESIAMTWIVELPQMYMFQVNMNGMSSDTLMVYVVAESGEETLLGLWHGSNTATFMAQRLRIVFNTVEASEESGFMISYWLQDEFVPIPVPVPLPVVPVPIPAPVILPPRGDTPAPAPVNAGGQDGEYDYHNHASILWPTTALLLALVILLA